MNRKKLILIIDDDEAICTWAAHRFRQAGYPALATGDTDFALDLAEQHQPQLILLDLHIPATSGIRILKRLKNNPRTATISVIVLSNDATVGAIDQAFEAGADAYLNKYDCHDTLVQSVRLKMQKIHTVHTKQSHSFFQTFNRFV